MIDKPIVENLECMKGPQPLHFDPQAAACTSPRRKFPKARVPGREGIFIPLKFTVRALPSAQENMQSEENDPSFSSGASTLSMPWNPRSVADRGAVI
ncbi:MAG: hypothetical protein IJU12_10825 [Clostridia bacterium]|nr:hypothetical protein [Clostridia bacterium]